MKKSALAVAMTVALTAACTSGPQQPSPEPSASTEPSPPAATQEPTPARDRLLAIPRGPRTRASWFRTAMVTLHGGERRVWLHAEHPQRVSRVARYRGGYIVSAYDRQQVRTGGAVFDADGQRVRRLGRCVTDPVSSPDGRRVAWATCAEQDWTLRVGPSRDPAVPDLELALPSDPATAPYPVAIGDEGVTVQRADPFRGYPRGASVIDLATGAARHLEGVSQVESVSPGGIACVERDGDEFSLLDLKTGEHLRRLRRSVEAWSPDGTQALMPTDFSNQSWNVVDTITGKVLRRFELPAWLWASEARWEDASNLLFVINRHAWTTIIRVLPSGEIQRVSSVMPDDDLPSFL